ncbi:MAG: diapolycopene oxygenase, partial [Elusimicrobia bacterium]|nr:diapolycopene oxygenase [Elusimicrobiota bacterium]MBD3411977.1 diapolycopene oxygenase [Elusimicrobiota bacterium]
HVKLQSVVPHWRNFFDDKTVIDLHMDPVAMAQELIRIGGPKLEKKFRSFLSYAGKQYDIIEQGYFEHGLDTKKEFMDFYDSKSLLRMDYWTTMHRRNRKTLGNRYMIDIMDYFIKYVGSSALRAPAFMNLLSVIQFRYDLWYVAGGMYNLAAALEQLARSLDITIELNQEVIRLETDQGRISGVRLADQRFCASDIVVSNMEVIPAYQRLLNEDSSFLKTLAAFEPACSGLVLHLGTDRPYPQLAHHNFVYARDQQKHFKTVFEEGRIPEDPTLYVVAPSRTDPSVCPQGCDNIKILPHIPNLKSPVHARTEDYEALRERILIKMERIGLKDLRKHIIVQDMWTPHDIQQRYYSNGGAIYGVVSDRSKNFALKAPKQSQKYPNLFFVGGSVNPGGGMPMVILCGQNVAEMIEKKVVTHVL